MEIEHLHEFSVLARQLNFREAASALHISQSALSRHIAALEDFYGMPLFTRDRHSVHLTDAGAFVLEYTEALWSQFCQSRDHAQQLFAGEHHLRISGVIGHPSLYSWIRDAETRLHQADPAASLHIERNANPLPASQIEELRAGNADCAMLFSVRDDLDTPEDIEQSLIGPVPMALVVRKEHPLASEPVITADLLQNGRFLQFVGPDYSPHWKVFSELLDNAGVAYTTAPRPADSEYDVIRAVDTMGECLYLLQRSSVLPAVAANPDAVLVPLDESAFTLNLTLLRLKGHKDHLAALALQCLRESYRTFVDTLPR